MRPMRFAYNYYNSIRWKAACKETNRFSHRAIDTSKQAGAFRSRRCAAGFHLPFLRCNKGLFSSSPQIFDRLAPLENIEQEAQRFAALAIKDWIDLNDFARFIASESQQGGMHG